MGSSVVIEISGDSDTESESGIATPDSDIDLEDDSKEDDAVDSPPPIESSPYQEGEKVLAFHNQRVYEAKVQRIGFQMNEWRYFIHYIGWNKSWDEWVGFDRLMKHTEENLQKEKEINEKQDMNKNVKNGRALQIKPKSSNGRSVAKGRKRKTGQKDKGTLLVEKRVNIHIPATLKKQLIDDCESTTHLGKLVKLPRSPNVEEILSKYHDYRLTKDGQIVGSVGEILNGLRSYFDKALPAMLLYKNERHQYEEMVSDNVTPSAIYGAEHLLRLFVKLPEILYYANIEETTLVELQQNLVNFLKYLQKNQSSFFHSAYRIGL
ncbi:hypothetical protein M9H77_32435 [Catharanthus roseus]|uniref:Uncharacterized protein n=1 Tax=Catharanthus roseus TaxID=4058 RepID=A0ACC0A5E1_CATRO|nr:hypothetical protein M9H77_32435 [Catharanthus roseus]